MARKITHFASGRERERESKKRKRKKEKSKLLSSTYGVPLIGIRRAKSESLSTRRRLRVSTKKGDFTEDPNEEISGNQIFLGLEGVLETSFYSTTLQEVVPTLVYFPL